MLTFFNKRLRNRKGFTLIELIVVIAIIGILAAIAVPRLGAFRSNADETARIATARTIASAINLAEADADSNPATPADVMAFLDDTTLTVSASGTADSWTYELTTGTGGEITAITVRYGTTTYYPAP